MILHIPGFVGRDGETILREVRKMISTGRRLAKLAERAVSSASASGESSSQSSPINKEAVAYLRAQLLPYMI